MFQEIEEDVTRLQSPLQHFQTPSLLYFYVKMKVQPRLVRALSTIVSVFFVNGIGQRSRDILQISERTDGLWVKYYICVEEGWFSLVVQAAKGLEFVDVYFDTVGVVSNTTVIPETLSNSTIIHQYGDDTFDPDDLNQSDDVTVRTPVQIISMCSTTQGKSPVQ